jgi:hypothetical protein
MGVRYEFGKLLGAFDNALFDALFYFFVLFGLRVLLRKQWIAAIAFVMIMSFITTFGTSTPWVDYPVAAVEVAVFAFVLLRFGLLAAMAADGCIQLLEACPPTLDFSSWYLGLALIPPALVALIAVYGFRISLAGRPLIREV